MKKNHIIWTFAMLMLVVGMSSCSKSDSEEIANEEPVNEEVTNDEPLSNEGNDYKPIELTRAEQELVTANNDFAFNLFRKAGPRMTNGASGPCFTEPNKSTILSPISITYALGMLNNGAAGETQAQINKVLGFGETGADGINTFCQKMLTEAPKLDKLTKVMIANTIYMNQNYQLKPDFVTKAKDYYDAEPETRNFADGKTMDVINQWASDHTEKMIDKVLNEDEFDPSAVSYLLNAIYFKGAWAEKFDKTNTKDEIFRNEINQETQVPMMHQEHEFNYTEDEDCQALCLPYGNNAYRMTILLPKEGRTVYSLAQKLTTQTWQRYQWMGTAIDLYRSDEAGGLYQTQRGGHRGSGGHGDRNEGECNASRTKARELPRHASVHIRHQRTVDRRHLLHRTIYGRLKSAKGFRTLIPL